MQTPAAPTPAGLGLRLPRQPLAAASQLAGQPITPVIGQRSNAVISIIARAAFMVVALTGLVATFLTAQAKGEVTKQQALVDAAQKSLRTGPTATALGRLKTIEQELQVLASFVKDAPPWPSILDDLAHALPKSVKLTDATFGADKKVRLEGEAASQQDIATFMAALEKSDRFATPTLSSVTLNESTNSSVVVFSLSTELKATPSSVVSRQSSVEAGPSSASPSTTTTAPTPTPTGPDATSASSTTGSAPSGLRGSSGR